jgi:hypothetical protein
MSLSTPLIPADRTPVVLTQERATTLPPEPRAALADTAVLVAVWAALCVCALVIVAGVVMLAALAGGAL